MGGGEKKDRHEGRLILAELERLGHSITALGRACGQTAGPRQNAYRLGEYYVSAKRLGDKAWSTCRRGLMELGIDPDLIRPSGLVDLAVTQDTVEDLRGELGAFKGHFKVLRRMLVAPDGVRSALVGDIDRALKYSGK